MIALDASHVAVDLPGQVVELGLDGKLLAAHAVVGPVTALAYVDGRLWVGTPEALYAWQGKDLVIARAARRVSGIGPVVPDAVGAVRDGVLVEDGGTFAAACLRGPDGETWCNLHGAARRMRDDFEIRGTLLAGGAPGLVILGRQVGLHDARGMILRVLPSAEVAIAGDVIAVRSEGRVELSGGRKAAWSIPAVPVAAPMLVPIGSQLVDRDAWVERIDRATGAVLERYAAARAEVVNRRIVRERPSLTEGTNALVYEDGASRWVAGIAGQPGPRLGDVVTLVGEDLAIYGLAASTGAQRWRVPMREGATPATRRDSWPSVHRAGDWLVVAPAAGEWLTIDGAGKPGRKGDGDLWDCDGDAPMVAYTLPTGPTMQDLRDGATVAVPDGVCPVGRLADGGFVWQGPDAVGVSDTSGVRWIQRGFGHPPAAGVAGDLVLLGWAGLAAVDGVTGEPRWTRADGGGVEGFIRVP